MARFESCMDYVLRNEGGYSNLAADRGGATNWGITHDELARWRMHPVSTQDVHDMPKGEALSIYRAHYWGPLGLDRVDSDAIAAAIMDIGVNRGVSVGAQYAQEVCNHLSQANLIVDKKMGPRTCEAINRCNEIDFVRALELRMQQGYDAIVRSRPSQRVFYKGWMNRALRLLTLIRKPNSDKKAG